MTPEQRQKIIADYGEGYPESSIAARAGIRFTELLTERAADPSFAKDCDDAGAAWLQRTITPIVKRARRGNKEAAKALDDMGIDWRPKVSFDVVTPSDPRHPDHKSA